MSLFLCFLVAGLADSTNGTIAKDESLPELQTATTPKVEPPATATLAEEDEGSAPPRRLAAAVAADGTVTTEFVNPGNNRQEEIRPTTAELDTKGEASANETSLETLTKTPESDPVTLAAAPIDSMTQSAAPTDSVTKDAAPTDLMASKDDTPKDDTVEAAKSASLAESSLPVGMAVADEPAQLRTHTSNGSDAEETVVEEVKEKHEKDVENAEAAASDGVRPPKKMMIPVAFDEAKITAKRQLMWDTLSSTMLPPSVPASRSLSMLEFFHKPPQRIAKYVKVCEIVFLALPAVIAILFLIVSKRAADLEAQAKNKEEAPEHEQLAALRARQGKMARDWEKASANE